MSFILRIAIAAGLVLSSPPLAAREMPPEASQFAPCKDVARHASLAATECARIAAPLNHGDPGSENVELFVRRFPADGQSRGELWLIAGGPGEAGASFYPFIDALRDAAPGYDLIIPDHRGTGFSTRMCPAEESPASPGGVSLMGSEWGSCFASLNASPARTKAFSTTNAARDLRYLMARIGGGGPRALYGVSYGTQLVLRALAIGEEKIADKVILDSLVPPEDTERFDLSRRSAVTDAVGRTVLAECDAQADCARYFRGTTAEALADILADKDLAEPLGERPKYTLGALLDLPETRATIPYVVAGLRAGDPRWFEYAKSRLEQLGAVYAAFPQATSSIPLVSIISRSENNPRPALDKATIAREEADLLFASPLPSLLLMGGFPAYEKDTLFAAPPRDLPPTLVLHGTLDPKTPIEGARQHIALIDRAGSVELKAIEQAPHFILMSAPKRFAQAVRNFIGTNPTTE